MIQLSEAFNMIGVNGCSDVATSLAMQGTDPEISIPIYEIFYLKLLAGDKTGFLAGNIPEYNAIRKMAESCGAVAATVNLLDMDILTLLGVVMIYTPNTGMNVFIKLGELLTGELEEEIIHSIAALAGVPVPDSAFVSTEFVGEVLQMLLDRLIDILEENLSTCGINLHHWEELPNLYAEITESGEMTEMYHYRSMINAALF